MNYILQGLLHNAKLWSDLKVSLVFYFITIETLLLGAKSHSLSRLNLVKYAKANDKEARDINGGSSTFEVDYTLCKLLFL